MKVSFVDLFLLPFISCLYVTIMCNYCKVSDDSPPSRVISHCQVNQDLVNDIERKIFFFLFFLLVEISYILSCIDAQKASKMNMPAPIDVNQHSNLVLFKKET